MAAPLSEQMSAAVKADPTTSTFCRQTLLPLGSGGATQRSGRSGPGRGID